MKVADSNRLAGIITVDDFCFDYDYEVTPEVFHEWTEKLLAACRASADDDAVHDMKGNGDSPTYLEAIASYFWQYRYKGITYDFRTQLTSKGFRGVMNLYVTVPTKK
ncbi:MAG: hypothetical protein LBR49_08125 [Tannerella sp.]|jgi:hypothetical protein|nr:hypothetical protein [Tannerella sp.]